MSTRRAVVTGLGCVSALGASATELWENMKKGRSGIRTVDAYREFPASVFAPVDLPSSVLVGDVAPEVRRNLTRPMELLYSAVREALGQAKLLGVTDTLPVGLIAGTTANYPVEMEPEAVAGFYTADDEIDWPKGPEALLQYYACSKDATDGGVDWAKFLRTHAYPRNHMLRHMTNLLTCFPAMHFRLRGVNQTIHNACASGTQAVGAAFRLIKHGRAEVVLAGGTDTLVNWAGVTALAKLGVLSPQPDPTKACRPFDAKRDGLVLGDGAGILVIESLESAERRGAPILAEVVGFGSTANAYRITDSPVEGKSASVAITESLREAGIEPKHVDVISAHATSTPQNDLAEANAIKRALGDVATRIPTIAPKALLGHTLSGAGAVELVAAVRTLQTGFLPPAPSHREPDPEINLSVVVEPAQAPVTYLLKNSFGFGGQNGALILKKWSESAGGDAR